jgi:group II intron reverse transcriptase/maturase
MAKTSEKSYAVVVPGKSAKTWVTPVESMEERTKAKGIPAGRNAPPTQGGTSARTDLQRVGQRAKQKPTEKWTNLLCHIRVSLLEEAYKSLRKSAAPGVDGVDWETYGEHLGERLTDLCDRIHRGDYHPQPVRRVEIPKGDGKTRPLGIPALEDKIVQQAVRWVLEPIYEALFIGFSYGFRPKRSAHDALDALATAIYQRVNWLLDADIRSFFDTIDHGWMQRFVEHRIGDKRLVHLLMRWMKAGVMKDGALHAVKEGTPQGGIISPLLANIYLHYVLDLWVNQWRKTQARGRVYVVRYADDFVVGLEAEQDAHELRRSLEDRLAKFGLELHPDKTRVIRFGRFARVDRERRGLSKPETFEFLGFLHIAARDMQGKFQLRRHTSRKKMRAKLARIKEECKRRRHAPVGAQHAWLQRVLRGHDNYYAVPTNTTPLRKFHVAVERTWHRWLQRRSQRGRWSGKQWDRFRERFPLPPPRILHPWPTERFHARFN